MKRSISHMIYAIYFFGIISQMTVSCAKTGMSSSTSGPAISFITIMNLAPYGDSTSIYFNGSVYPTIYPVTTYSDTYFSLASGIYDVQFKTSNSSDSLLAEIPASPFDSLGDYTLILYNDTAHGKVKTVKIIDNFSTVTSSSAYYRFFNMATDMPSLDLYINNVKVQSNRTVADNVQNTLYNNFQPISDGYVSIQVKQAGTNLVVANTLTGTLNLGEPYTIFLQEALSSSGITYSLSILAATL